ncbi:MAG: NADH dehydrogenase [Bacteroidetes bacterium GWF2_42_66]|nr:MAG: NADH dehydrogenase [Bacteroidetes bacterium GWA2_42_15]OFX99198.1 MAG: NADH dehydrogenase [Bacteroidetes bacterium GWE2_42_39]OFY40594.1 MAG: NADH dehydrogenase [Bacteroidetes bacterium GWF2_42_66]HBL74547.1 FAD-dependent oxidoreductase [Prolixibacteraceae bacterium]HCR89005.1 FAD-dependent oxidoreductase [Prolixibacteraceae bacterium]
MAINIPETGQKRLVILGAGFAGLKLARELVNSDFQIVLIDKNNYHQFQPLFYQVATAGLEPSAISFPLRKIFQQKKNIFVRVAEVQKIDADKHQISTEIGPLKYDYLVVATGVRTSYFGMENISNHAIPMKTVAQALALRNRVLSNFELAVTITDREKLKELLNIVVVGGGPTGVEVSGALADLKNFVLPKDYPDLDFSLMEVSLVEASEHLVGGMSKLASRKSKIYLEKLGIHVYTGTRVVDYDGHTVTFQDGRSIQSNTMIWAAGITGTYPDGINRERAVRGNRLPVDRYNRLPDVEDVFVLGDLAYMQTEKYPNGHPQLAQVAIQQARNLARNLKRMNESRELRKFEYADKGSMATVGRNLAVVDFPFLRFGGRIAWLIWMFVHLMSIVGVKNRMLVFINWFWNYITYDQSLRLIIKPFRKV